MPQNTTNKKEHTEKREDNTTRNYENLIKKIENLTNQEFKENILKNKNLINTKAKEYKDEQLINELNKANTKQEYINIIKNRIDEIEIQKKELSNLVKQRQEIIRKKTNFFPGLWISIYIIFFAIIIFQHVYFTSQLTELKVQIYQEQENIKNVNEEKQQILAKEQERETQIKQLEQTNQELQQRINYLLNESTKANLLRTEGPKSRISAENITITEQGITIALNDPLFARFQDTKSMIPTINVNSKAIQITPNTQQDIIVGDIISFESQEKIIIHRVIEIGQDEQGWYAITKGDNAIQPDKEKVRFEQIKRILVAIIY